jgi:hypothetical protein
MISASFRIMTLGLGGEQRQEHFTISTPPKYSILLSSQIISINVGINFAGMRIKPVRHANGWKTV